MYSSARPFTYDQGPRPRPTPPMYTTTRKEFAVVPTSTRLIPSSSYATPSTAVHSSSLPTFDSSFRPSYRPHNIHPRDLRYGFDTERIIEDRSGRMNRGLRHFSMKVCEKVKQKGRTNYHEVADELVSEYFDSLSETPDPKLQTYDMKNIRRRVYDALNVLMALNIIAKQNKEIRWNGLPTTPAQEIKNLENERTKKEEKLREKYEQCMDLMLQLVAYKNLISRNRQREVESGMRPPPNSVLYMPFLVITGENNSEVEISIAGDKSEYMLVFDRPFDMFDDVEALKRLSLHGLIDQSAHHFPIEVRHHTKMHMPPLLKPFVDEVFNEIERARGAERQALLREAQPAKPIIPGYTAVRASSLARVGQVSMQAPAIRPTRLASLSHSAPNVGASTSSGGGTPYISMRPGTTLRRAHAQPTTQVVKMEDYAVNQVGTLIDDGSEVVIEEYPIDEVIDTGHHPHHQHHEQHIVMDHDVYVHDGSPIVVKKQGAQYAPYYTTKDGTIIEEVDLDQFDDVIYEEVAATEEIAFE